MQLHHAFFIVVFSLPRSHCDVERTTNSRFFAAAVFGVLAVVALPAVAAAPAAAAAAVTPPAPGASTRPTHTLTR